MNEPIDRGTVLVVEDDPGIRLLQRSTLERAGFTVALAANGAEAREQIALGSVDLLLLDYYLQDGETGLEFYRALQSSGRGIPAILVTGTSDEARLLEAMRAGVRDFIQKTPNFMELVAPTVERVMADVRGERRLREMEAASQAKDDFLAALSHELRTPLTPVLALVSVLRTDPRLPEDLRGDIETIQRNITLEARLIDDLLDLTRITRGKLELRWETVEIRPVLAHASATVCHGAPAAGVDCRISLAPGIHHVLGDSARLTQIFWNLLSNAVKFTPRGGQVLLQSRVEGEDGSQRLVVEIIDSGMGIAPELLPHIFSAFEQGGVGTTRRFGGLGLGLAIARFLVELHRGTLEAESEGLGKGATFTVTLPLAAAPVAEPLPLAASPAEAVRRGPARLLLVEDHLDTARIFARLLGRAGFTVALAHTVADALAAAAAEPMDLVVSDLGLPDGTGLDLMRQLRARHEIPGIALSGFGMEEDVRRTMEAGFAAHLTKPVDFERLLEVIEETLAAERGM